MQEDVFNEDLPISPYAPQSKSDEIYSSVIQEKRIENLLEQLNPDRLIVEIEWRLKGYKKNAYTRQWELIGKNPKEVSEELIGDFLSILSANLTNNTTLSNFTPDEINKIINLFVIKFIDIIRANSEKYGLEQDYAERDRILLITLSSIFYALKRAQGGNESRRTFDSLQMRDSGVQMQQQKGVLGRLLNI